ncbi:MAG: FeoC-like transcriptional regulator [Micrococcales bacterium]|nr:FeoC-like transcriptional regulator [Micrococcales bacterium]
MSRRPLSAVLAAFEAGAESLDDVSRRTGLDRDVVSAAVDQLVRMGRIDARELAIGCPSGGCGSCASGTSDGQAGCGADGPSGTRSGPVLVTLSLRRPSA